MPILTAQPGKFIDNRLFPVALRIERENHPYGGSLFLVDNVCTVDLISVIADNVAATVKHAVLPAYLLPGKNTL